MDSAFPIIKLIVSVLAFSGIPLFFAAYWLRDFIRGGSAEQVTGTIAGYEVQAISGYSDHDTPTHDYYAAMKISYTFGGRKRHTFHPISIEIPSYLPFSRFLAQRSINRRLTRQPEGTEILIWVWRNGKEIKTSNSHPRRLWKLLPPLLSLIVVSIGTIYSLSTFLGETAFIPTEDRANARSIELDIAEYGTLALNGTVWVLDWEEDGRIMIELTERDFLAEILIADSDGNRLHEIQYDLEAEPFVTELVAGRYYMRVITSNTSPNSTDSYRIIVRQQ